MTFRMKSIAMSIFVCAAIFMFSAPAMAAEKVLADKTNLDTVRMNLKEGKGSAYRARWSGTYVNSEGKEIPVMLIAAVLRTSPQNSSYSWKDIYSRIGNTELVAELYVNHRQVMFVENPGTTAMEFNYLMPDGVVLEFFLDASTYSTSMTLDAKASGNMPCLVDICE